MTTRVPRVCHLVVSLQSGGLEQLVVNWTNARNVRHGASTEVCTLDDAGPLEKQVTAGCVSSIGAERGRFPWDRRAVRDLRSRLAGVDVVHSHNLAAQQYAALACRGIATAHVHTEHGSNPHVSGPVNRLRLWWVGRMTDRCVCVSSDTAMKMRTKWGLPADAVSVILNGVALRPPLDAERRSALRASVTGEPNVFLVGSVGRLSSEKRYDRLLRAVAEAHANSADRSIGLVLVGDGSERGQLEALALELGIEEHVTFAGFREDARALLETLDLFVLSSETEGLPVSLLEAMAAKCPTAITDVGDCRHVVDDGRCGIVLPDDARTWGQLFVSLSRDPEQLAGLAERAYGRAESEFSEAHTLNAYESIYTTLVSGAA